MAFDGFRKWKQTRVPRFRNVIEVLFLRLNSYWLVRTVNGLKEIVNWCPEKYPNRKLVECNN